MNFLLLQNEIKFDTIPIRAARICVRVLGLVLDVYWFERFARGSN